MKGRLARSIRARRRGLPQIGPCSHGSLRPPRHLPGSRTIRTARPPSDSTPRHSRKRVRRPCLSALRFSQARSLLRSPRRAPPPLRSQRSASRPNGARTTMRCPASAWRGRRRRSSRRRRSPRPKRRSNATATSPRAAAGECFRRANACASERTARAWSPCASASSRRATLDPAAGSSPVYDSYVEAGVRRFQARHGLNTTGAMNSATLAAMNVPAQVRLRQLETQPRAPALQRRQPRPPLRDREHPGRPGRDRGGRPGRHPARRRRRQDRPAVAGHERQDPRRSISTRSGRCRPRSSART